MSAKENIQKLQPVDMGDDIKKAFDELRLIAETDVPTIREEFFVQHLLPVLTDTSGEADLSIWLDIAGAASRPIDVVDGVGKKLFRIPALVRTLPTRPNSSPQHSMFEIVETAKKKTENHPLMGSTYLQMQLERKIGLTGPDLELVREWNQILIRYGKEPLPLPMTADEKQAAEAPATTSVFTGEDEDL